MNEPGRVNNWALVRGWELERLVVRDIDGAYQEWKRRNLCPHTTDPLQLVTCCRKCISNIEDATHATS